MPEDGEPSDRVELTKRQFIGTAIGTGVLGTTPLAGADTVRPNGGGGGGGGDGFDGGDRAPSEHTVTLITGHTIVVTERTRQTDGDDAVDGEREVERTYEVVGEDREGYRLLEDDHGTYFLPHGVDLDRLDRELFNVDYLVNNGFTDEEMDTIPVVAKMAPETRDVRTSTVGTLGTGARTLASIGAVATEFPKHDLATMDVGTLAREVTYLHLDKKYEALLDESAPRIAAPAARDQFGVDGSGVRIAVIDTGIDADHPDLDDRVVYQNDFTGAGTADRQGHGTHVAGIAAGDGTESDGGYVGVAPGASLMSLKALGGRRGTGTLSDIIQAIEDAVANDADVINMSLGGPTADDDPLAEAVNWAHDQGVVSVAAAGNEFQNAPFRSVSSPAVAESAIAVGASDDDDEDDGGRRRSRGTTLASARGPSDYTFLVKPEVSAPGVRITAAGSGDAGEAPYAEKTGTSMSTPHVAGLVALLLEEDSSLAPDAVRDRLVATSNFETGRDVYKQGGGEVDAVAAMDGDLLVHDAVLNWGLVQDSIRDTRSITVENLGAETKTVDVSATLRNEADDENLSDQVSVDPGSVVIDPGETASVDLTIDTSDAFGYNAGVVTFDDGDGVYNAVFGFTRGLDLTVEKTVHERRRTAGDDAAGDIAWIWSHDGQISKNGLFDADGEWRPLVFRSEATVTMWSTSTLPPDGSAGQRENGDPVLTASADVQVDASNKTIELDENETEPHTVDTSALDDRPTHEAFDDSDIAAFLFGVTDGAIKVLANGYAGNNNVFTAHYTPVDDTGSTNVATEWRFYPTHDGDYHYAVDDVYWLFEPLESMPAGGERVAVNHDELAAEEFRYHRETEDQLLSVTPILFPTDEEAFPMPISGGFLRRIGRDVEAQTWWKTPEAAEYAEIWQDNDSTTNRTWVAQRLDRFVPQDAGTYEATLNRAPPVQTVRDYYGTVVDPEAIFQWVRMHDQRPEQFEFGPVDVSGGYQVFHEGDLVTEDRSAGPAPYRPIDVEDPPAMDAGDRVNIRYDGQDRSRDPPVGLEIDYEVTYDPTTSNQPPLVENVHAPFLDTYNRLPAGDAVFWIELNPAQSVQQYDQDRPTTIERFEAYYSDGTPETSPFRDDAGWREAEVVYRDGPIVGIRVTDLGPEMDLALAAANGDGNVVRQTTLRAYPIAQPGLRIDTRVEVLGSNAEQTVPVVVEPTAGIDPTSDIAVDSLRFGAGGAVERGEGASPVRHQPLDSGELEVHFRADETGYVGGRSPATTVLAGELTDGTPVYGADVISAVRGDCVPPSEASRDTPKALLCDGNRDEGRSDDGDGGADRRDSQGTGEGDRRGRGRGDGDTDGREDGETDDHRDGGR